MKTPSLVITPLINCTIYSQIKGTEIGWSLGFMISQSVDIPQAGPHEHLSLVTFILLMILFSVFVFICVGFIIYALKTRRSRSNSLYEPINSYGAI